MKQDMSILSSAYKNEFSLDNGRIYLNHAAQSPWPRRMLAVIERLSREMNMGIPRHREWLAVEQRLRKRLQQLIGAPSSEDIALLKNTSEGLSIVAHGIGWRAGDNIVITDQEFPSNRIVWQSLASQGVEVREAPISAGATPSDDDAPEETPEAIIEHTCDEHTRMIAVSSVQYATGLRMDSGRIGRFCRQKDILFCVDAIQSLGALSMDVQSIDADFLVAGGHKWMLGPEGIAVFYCRRELRDRLILRQHGWHMVEDYLNFDNKAWRSADSARRFECGSPNTLGIHALDASLSWLLEVGMDRVSQGILRNTAYLLQAIAENEKLSPLFPAMVSDNPNRRSGIVTFHAPGMATRELFRELTASGIICAPRGGGIRFSPHFYTPMAHLESAMERVGDLASGVSGKTQKR
uniref:Selenocysteine lyase/Cysteine desulfurase n=1 Tax=Candidatus Kentrum sp. TC TaxID=2126339 RepID=A0A450Y9A7_9GAMM|nr:MAG: Selenocysteine lyase/Cysteine desulfurase [Candidatus Kentron sp. TC]